MGRLGKGLDLNVSQPPEAQPHLILRRLKHPEPAELALLAMLDREAFGSTGLSEYDLALMAHAGVLLVAEEAQVRVGACQLMRMVDDPGLLWVVGLYILPGFRHARRGRAFLGEIVSLLPSWGARGLVLTVHPNNEVARRLYRHFGFRRVDSLPEFYGQGEERELLILDPARESQQAVGGTNG